MGCDIIKKDKVVFAGLMMYNGEKTMIRRDFSLKKIHGQWPLCRGFHVGNLLERIYHSLFWGCDGPL